jgi:hypothetical protein
MPEDLPREHVRGEPIPSRLKPTVAQLGVDLAAQDWHRSGAGDGSFEVAFVRGAAGRVGGASQAAVRSDASSSAASRPDASRAAGADDIWVLLRVAGDPAERVLVYDRVEWECFLDGAGRGEFDDAQ